MKKIVNIGLVLLLCLFFITGCKKEDKKNDVNDNGTLKEEKNNNKGVLKEQVIDGITISGVKLNSTTYSATMSINATNDTENDITLEYFKVYFKDEDGNNILGGDSFALIPVFDTIKSKETKVLSTNIDRNLSSVYSVSYEIVK